MSLETDIAQLVDKLTHADLTVLKPHQLKSLAALCRYVADKADPPPPADTAAKAPFLAELRDGRGFG